MPDLKLLSVGHDLGPTFPDFARYTDDDIAAFRKARPDVELRLNGKIYPAEKKQ